MLPQLCAEFQVEVEALDADDVGDYAAQLRRLTLKLARDAALEIADHHYGEIPALCQRCHEVLAWLAAEAEDVEDRQRRYGRQQTVLNLLVLAEGIVRFHSGQGTRKARDEAAAALRDHVADALQALVPGDI